MADVIHRAYSATRLVPDKHRSETRRSGSILCVRARGSNDDPSTIFGTEASEDATDDHPTAIGSSPSTVLSENILRRTAATGPSHLGVVIAPVIEASASVLDIRMLENKLQALWARKIARRATRDTRSDSIISPGLGARQERVRSRPDHQQQ